MVNCFGDGGTEDYNLETSQSFTDQGWKIPGTLEKPRVVVCHGVFICFCPCVCVPSCSVMSFATPRTAARQAPVSMGFSRQEYLNGLPFSTPGDIPDPGIQLESPASPALQADSLPLSHLGSSFPRQQYTYPQTLSFMYFLFFLNLNLFILIGG